jgi:hypothetical protein
MKFVKWWPASWPAKLCRSNRGNGIGMNQGAPSVFLAKHSGLAVLDSSSRQRRRATPAQRLSHIWWLAVRDAGLFLASHPKPRRPSARRGMDANRIQRLKQIAGLTPQVSLGALTGFSTSLWMPFDALPCCGRMKLCGSDSRRLDRAIVV